MNLCWTTAADWLLHCAVGGGMLLLLTCLLMRRTTEPVKRQRLGEWGLAAALVLAVLSLGPPWLIVGVAAPPAPDAVPVEPAVPPDNVIAWGPGDLEAQAWPGLPLEPLHHPEPAEAEAVPLPALELAEAEGRPWWQEGLAVVLPWLVVAWAVSALVLACRWLLGHVGLARLLRAARPAPDEVERLFEEMAPGPNRPRLLVSTRLRVPISCGLLRPTVLLPASMCEPLDVQKLRWVFAHELTHLERRDAWSAVLFAVGQAVYFFVPWFRWLRRQVRLCQEYIADSAAAGNHEPADYAEFLLSLSGAPAAGAACATCAQA
ncbi:MAG: M56 family metallopeptidase, partial [Gemmataceae bacterium]|nr:M56 family metallopeptidase [Gemmataceae bacterium]